MTWFFYILRLLHPEYPVEKMERLISPSIQLVVKGGLISILITQQHKKNKYGSFQVRPDFDFYGVYKHFQIRRLYISLHIW